MDPANVGRTLVGTLFVYFVDSNKPAEYPNVELDVLKEEPPGP